MSSKLLRRIAKEQRSLRAAPPADYFFCDSTSSSHPSSSSLNDDITTVEIFMLGPVATPYENGVFRLSLKMTTEYPNEPPVANFRTKIFHANIEENTGDVCVDTLKSGWTSDLTLNDVLVTIRCLLIHPNPASALNSEAASLAETDYKAFEKYAQMFTKIHASPSADMKQVVKDARAARKHSAGSDEKAKSKDAASSSTKPADTGPVSSKESDSEGKDHGKSESVKVTRGDPDEEGKENSRSGPANTSNTPTSSTSSSSFVTPQKRSLEDISLPNPPNNSNDSQNNDNMCTPPPKRLLRSNTKASISAAGAGAGIASKKVIGGRPGAKKRRISGVSTRSVSSASNGGRSVSGSSTRSVSSSSSKAVDPKRGLRRL